MAQRGDTLENPVTGERITFLATAAGTGGGLLRFDLVVPAGVAVPMAHVHMRQEERFEVRAGTGRFRVGGAIVVARAGDTVVVPPRIPHRFWNDGAGDLELTVEFRPALRTEQFFQQLWGPGLTRWALPGPRLAAQPASQGFLDEVSLPRIPMPVQRGAQRLLAALARLPAAAKHASGAT
jgi:mannose-6-phosphate isomerase-like protein (cupin superfamily)